MSAVDQCEGVLPVTVNVFADEDDDGTGDGNTSPDAVDIDVGSLQLRGERKGNGDGRVYLIIPEATDSSGNRGFGCCTVVVPHSNAAAAQQAVQAPGGGGARLLPRQCRHAAGRILRRRRLTSTGPTAVKGPRYPTLIGQNFHHRDTEARRARSPDAPTQLTQNVIGNGVVEVIQYINLAFSFLCLRVSVVRKL